MKGRPMLAEEAARSLLEALGIPTTLVSSVSVSMVAGEAVRVTIERWITAEELARIGERAGAAGER